MLTVRQVITVGAAAFMCAAPFSLDRSPTGRISFSLDSAQAVVGRPLTPGSVAGVARRTARRNAFACHYRYVIVDGVSVRRCI
jgi:hypothetical protein